MGHFLYQLDSDVRKTRRLEYLLLKIIKKKYSVVVNKACLNNNWLPKYTHVCVCNMVLVSHDNLSKHLSCRFYYIDAPLGR